MNKVMRIFIIIFLFIISVFAYERYGEIVLSIAAISFLGYIIWLMFKEKQQKIEKLENEFKIIYNDSSRLLFLVNFIFLEPDLRKRKQARIAGSFFDYKEFDKKIWAKITFTSEDFWDDDYENSEMNENKLEYFKKKFVSQIEILNERYGFETHSNIERKNELFLKRWEKFLENDSRNK